MASASQRQRLVLAFKAASREAKESGAIPQSVQAQLAGYPHLSTFSSLMHSRYVPRTRLHVERMTRLAAALDYTGPVFIDDEEGVRP